MTQFIKAMRTVFCSILFISMASVFGSSLKRVESCELQADDSDKAREALKKAYYGISTLKSYRLRIEFPSDKTIREYVLPDRFHEITTRVERIHIGKDVYLKVGDDPWRKLHRTNSLVSYNTKLSLQHDVDNADDVKILGPDNLDGVPTLVYQGRLYFDGAKKEKPYNFKIWVNVADGLIRRVEHEAPDGYPKRVMFACTFYDYNADIKIEPPAKYDLEPALDSGKGGGIGSGEGTGVGPGGAYNTGGGTPPATSVDQRPVPLRCPRPNYTEEARRNKVQGIVRVKMLVGDDGNIRQVRVVSGLPDGLNDQAVRAAYQCRFKPAMKNGQPVSYWVSADMEFHLR